MNTEETKPENPPAFPMDYASSGFNMQHGMSLRDHFAGFAMQSNVSNLELMEKVAVMYKTDEEAFGKIAEMSYQMADAMLKERSK